MTESLLPDAKVFLVEDSGLPDLFADLLDQIEWKQSRSFVYGQWHDQPRMTALYGAETYDYSGVQYRPEDFNKSPALRQCKERVELLLDTPFNAVVCNLYRDGNDSIGWHSDNEPELGWTPLIASLSFGATRRFSFRRKRLRSTNFAPLRDHETDRHDIELRSGSMLVMFGETQRNWEHALLKTKKVTEPRINLTFRILGKRNG
jgi:alkylated DNA repair dioxygenase AlkB